MTDILAMQVACLAGFLAAVGSSYLLGYRMGQLKAPDYAGTAYLNEFLKVASKRETVSEMIAPGDKAEVVETDGHRAIAPLNDHELPANERRCIGCRYAGRYLL
jgi:hypothetical protein